MHDAFDFAHHEDIFRSIMPQTEQPRFPTLMLQDVCSCCDFMQSYPKDSQFCTLSPPASLAFCKHAIFRDARIKNIGGGPEAKIRELSDGLVNRRKAFLDQATLSTEITALQTSGRCSKNIHSSFRHRWVVFHGFWVTDPIVVVIELDAKIREIPYGVNSRFSPDKGYLVGTRVAFLDFIINWVNGPSLDSGRGLVLFGQAGTGKSGIAHEIARQFDKMHCLTSSLSSSGAP